MSTTLYLKYRPTKFSELYGNSTVIKILQKKVKTKKIPGAILATGPSGCGKTTILRILGIDLGAKEMDIIEHDSAHFRGIDTIRDVRQQMNRAPFGKCRVFIFDEVHQYPKLSQDAMLKMLEDTPKHVHFMLATTNPEKLTEALKQRCMSIKVRKLTETEIGTLVINIAKKEKRRLKNIVHKEIIKAANGSPRRALQILDAVLTLKKKSQQLDCIRNSDQDKKVEFLATKLMYDQKITWEKVTNIINDIEEEDEVMRRIICSYATKVALHKRGNYWPWERALVMIDCFSSPYYDVGPKTGLLWSVYQFMKTANARRK